MVAPEKACKLLGSSLETQWGEIVRRQNGAGYSIWHDDDDAIHVDFSGFSDSKDMETLRNLVVVIHADLETDAPLQVAFFGDPSEATEAMIRCLDDSYLRQDSGSRIP